MKSKSLNQHRQRQIKAWFFMPGMLPRMDIVITAVEDGYSNHSCWYSVFASARSWSAYCIRRLAHKTVLVINICKLELARSLGEDVCQALVGLHVFTGCDTVSAFAGRGKLGAQKLLKDSKTYSKGVQASWWIMECFYKPLWQIAGICVPDVRIHIYNLRCQRTPPPPPLFQIPKALDGP